MARTGLDFGIPIGEWCGEMQRLQRRRAALATAMCSACNGGVQRLQRRRAALATAACSACNSDVQRFAASHRIAGLLIATAVETPKTEVPWATVLQCCRHGPSTCCGVINKIFTRQIEDEKLAMCAQRHSDGSLSGWPAYRGDALRSAAAAALDRTAAVGTVWVLF